MKKQSAVMTVILGVLFLVTAAHAPWAADTGNGTVTVDGLVWLKDANCLSRGSWDRAKSQAAGLKAGQCGLTDGSYAGQWRLPTSVELYKRYGNHGEFKNVQMGDYWSSTPGSTSEYADVVNMQHGYLIGMKTWGDGYVWPVRNP